MDKKKKSSWFMEPINLILLIVSCARFVYDFVVVGVKSLKNDVQTTESIETNQAEASAKYIELRKSLDNDISKSAWRRYLITGLCMQGFLLLQIVLQGFSANIYMAATLIVILAIITLLFGYRPWILQTHQYHSFGVYLKNIPRNFNCLFLWTAFTALD